jgi:hypothetical protein
MEAEGALLYRKLPSLVAAELDDEPYGERELREDAETLGL